jgi:fatty-acyl-CoA synthase
VIAWGTESAVADAVAGGDRSAPHRPVAQSRLVLLTSGTTGTPKGAPRDLAMSLVAPGGFLSKIPFRTRRNAFVAAPVFHAWGLLSSSMALAVGDTVIVRRRFDPVVTLDAIAEHRCDVLAMVPVMLSRLLALGADEIALRDTSALRIICLSGSAVAPDLVARTREVFGDVLYNLYGSTEVSFATIATPDDLREEPACVGRAPFGVTVRLFDAHGRPVRPGEVGRIDMIISGGENVFPAEIEHLLGSHEGIVEAAVIGVADPEFGQRLRAYVVASPGSRLDEDAVRTFVRDNLARHKVPREVVFADALPRNPTGKVLKRELP